MKHGVVVLGVGLALVAVMLTGPLVRSTSPDRRAIGGFTSDFRVTSGTWADDGTTIARTRAPVFRAVSSRQDLGSPEVDFWFRIDAYDDGRGGEPVHDWDGVHVGVRYTSPDDLYYLSVARRDGTVAIKRKAEGEYETLATAPFEVSVDAWHRATVSVQDAEDGARLTLSIDGDEVLTALDTHQPLTGPGRVSLRSDNVTVAFDDLRVRDG